MTDTRTSDLGSTGTGTRSGPTHWVGLIVFAGILMMMGAVFQTIGGLMALVNDNYFAVGADGLPLNVNYTVWGWAHLIFGVLLFLAGLGVLSGNAISRTFGVILAAVNAIVALGFSAASPGWAVVLVSINVLVIYALTVHGSEMRQV
jgi:hypothetical protein